MGGRKAVKDLGLAGLIVERLGLKSKTGGKIMDHLHNKIASHPYRPVILADWQGHMAVQHGLQQPGAAASLLTKGETVLTPEDILLSRQTYYSMVVQLIAYYYLATYKKAVKQETPPVLHDLVNGRAYLPMGIANLALEGFPTWHVDGDCAWPAIITELLDQIRTLDLDGINRGDLFQSLYEDLIPRQVRHALGEHYTPLWLARHVMDQIGFYGQESVSFLDPSCGSGVFLVEAIARRTALETEPKLNILKQFCGLDVNPLAVLTAKVNYLIAMDYEPDGGESLEIPVYIMDTILEDGRGLWADSRIPPELLNSFDYVVGNPPWVNWESLSPEYRKATLQTWKDYGLFAHSGMDTILGKGKKDLSMLMTQICAAKYLKKEGKLAFLVTQSIFKSGGAAEGFRRFRLPQGTDLKVLKAEDLSKVDPFADAANRTGIIYLQRDLPNSYPVPYRLWSDIHFSENQRPQFNFVELMAEPVDQADITSPWLTSQGDCLGILHKILGSSHYRAHEGANTGGANGVLWVEVMEQIAPGLVRIRNLASSSRAGVDLYEAVIEDGLVFPLLKGKDLTRWQAVSSAGIIVCQDPILRKGIPMSVMDRTYPRTLEYLTHFEKELAGRAAYRRYFKETDPFYSMFDVGEYTMAPIKVVWHRFGGRMQAAVLEGGDNVVIPQETHCLVACSSSDEAWYLAGLLNSLPVEFALHSYAMVGGKSFASPNLFNYVKFPTFEGLPRQLMLAATARDTAEGKKNQEYLDKAAAKIYEITPAELAVIKDAWREVKT
ncbi:MAG: HsdM family class I SAM-dependent methyltransferase [Ignavibacteriales bacterium]